MRRPPRPPRPCRQWPLLAAVCGMVAAGAVARRFLQPSGRRWWAAPTSSPRPQPAGQRAAPQPGSHRAPPPHSAAPRTGAHPPPPPPDAASRSREEARSSPRPGAGHAVGRRSPRRLTASGVAAPTRRPGLPDPQPPPVGMPPPSFFGRNGGPSLPAGSDAAAAAKQWMREQAALPGVLRLRRGTLRQVLWNGSAPPERRQPASLYDKVQVHYAGAMPGGRYVDSSRKRGPTTFALNRVIAGWGEGLLRMCEGDAWRLILPPGLAYGVRGHKSIPGHMPLVFNVSLLKVRQGGKPCGADRPAPA
eukprot:TRINITY_DN8737_c0_g1_i1.p1 TRINITY_DN8737_c0_g1~~TRINITY_DN8737_c0_g1_i1.p1  ORF type:complete len:332 (+),score=56.36 TRINITY_DN8737_c0_g1_i1:86-997(+)